MGISRSILSSPTTKDKKDRVMSTPRDPLSSIPTDMSQSKPTKMSLSTNPSLKMNSTAGSEDIDLYSLH